MMEWNDCDYLFLFSCVFYFLFSDNLRARGIQIQSQVKNFSKKYSELRVSQNISISTGDSIKSYFQDRDRDEDQR